MSVTSAATPSNEKRQQLLGHEGGVLLRHPVAGMRDDDNAGVLGGLVQPSGEGLASGEFVAEEQDG